MPSNTLRQSSRTTSAQTSTTLRLMSSTSRPSRKAKNNVIKNNATNKAHVYEDCIITSTDCIATYNIEQLDETDPTHVTISGIVLTSEEGTLLKIDVSAKSGIKDLDS